MKKSFPILILGLILLGLPIAFADTISYDDFECNGFSCGTGWNGAWSYTGTCDITTLTSPQGVYMMRGQNGCTATRNFNNLDYGTSSVSFWATATSLEAPDFCRYYYYDGSTYTQLLQIADGQDTGTLQYYTFNVTPLNANAGLRMQTVGATGDYCYIDTITTTGTITPPSLTIFMDAQYPVGKTNVQVEMSSTIGNTNYTLELYNQTNGMFCQKTAISPVTPSTPFSVTCDMPTTPQTNAKALMYQTTNPAINQTDFFNVITPVHDSAKLKINRVYYSPVVLQGSATEIFVLIDKATGVTMTNLYTELVFPDNTTRRLSLEPTINTNEYKTFITDTFQTQNTTFTVRVEAGTYYDSYSNNYYVVPVVIDYVNNVGNVSVVKKVDATTMDVHGTEYIGGDNGKMFLQLLDGDKKAVTNSECFLSMWYPDGTNFLNNSYMYYLDQGLYYRNFIVPNNDGVYPAAAKCYIPLDFANIILENFATEGFESNTWQGGSGGWSSCPPGDPDCQEGWDIEDTVPLTTIITTGSADGPCKSGTYCARTTGSYGFLERGLDIPSESYAVNISFWFKFSGFQTNEHFDFYIFDGNWHREAQLGTTQAYGGYSNNVWYKWSYVAEAPEFEMGPWLIGWYATAHTPSTSDKFFVDDIRVDVRAPNITISNETAYQVLMGSGEAHVSKLFSTLNASIYSSSAKIDELLRIANSTKTQAQFITTQTYNLNDTGIVATRLTYSNGDFEYAETSATCNIVTRGPANASASPSYGPIVYNTTMSAIGNGVYYYSFVPTLLGIYNSEVTCTAGTGDTLRTYNAITQYRVEDDITSISIEGLSNLIEQMNLAFFEPGSNTTQWTISGIYQEYLNETAVMLFTGTEYNSNENGRIGVQVLKNKAGGGTEPITGMTCNSTIYYPNNTLYQSAIMTEILSPANGIYYHNFVTPETEGVYFDYTVCYDGIKPYSGLHSFHVAPWANQGVADEYSIFVSGTDYEPGDNGRTFIQLVRNGAGVNDAVCRMSVYKPSDTAANKTYYIQNGLLQSMGENGLYYYDFIAPSEIGIYSLVADCSVGENTTVVTPSSATVVQGSVVSGTFSDTFVEDGNYWIIDEQNNGGNNRSLVIDFNFNISSLPDPLNFAALGFRGRLQPSSPETVKFQIYNYSSSQFMDLPNELLSQSGSTDVQVANTGAGTCVSVGGDCRNATGFIKIRLQDTVQTADTSTHTIRIDRILAGGTYLVFTPVIGLSGGDEWNIRSHLTDILSTVTFINSTTMSINGTVTNIQSYLQTIVYSLLTDINYTVNNLNVTATVDLTSVETRLDTLKFVVDNMDDFTQEQIFLITDSVGQVKQIVSDTSTTEADVKQTLTQVETNLKRFMELSSSPGSDKPASFQITKQFDSGLIILTIAILGILILSKFDGLVRFDGGKRPPKEKVEEIQLPRSRNNTMRTYKGENL